jgi:uncharacterized alpha-E superfamily protein
VPFFRENIARCLEAADRCRLRAKQARKAFEKEAWLELADYWSELAEEFDRASDEPKLQ